MFIKTTTASSASLVFVAPPRIERNAPSHSKNWQWCSIAGAIGLVRSGDRSYRAMIT
jgi:hypothetical protein